MKLLQTEDIWSRHLQAGCPVTQPMVSKHWTSCAYQLFAFFVFFLALTFCLQWFDTLGWVSGRASGLYKIEWWGAGVVIRVPTG